jgi:hypothetical protein
MLPLAIFLGHVIDTFLNVNLNILDNTLKEKLDSVIGISFYFLIISDICNQNSINRIRQIECNHNHKKHGFWMENN